MCSRGHHRSDRRHRCNRSNRPCGPDRGYMRHRPPGSCRQQRDHCQYSASHWHRHGRQLRCDLLLQCGRESHRRRVRRGQWRRGAGLVSPPAQLLPRSRFDDRLQCLRHLHAMTSAESSLAELPPLGLWMQGAQTARLPWRFDTPAALAEVNALPASLWRTHFNEGRHDGGWQALALRSAPEAPIDVVPVDVAASRYADTPALDQCPTLRAMLDTMALPWKSVRLMQLLPGCEIKEHTDADLCVGRGEARLHVPLQTGERVFFHVDGERIPLRAGECWYVDVSRPHRVRNRGTLSRVHLVAD